MKRVKTLVVITLMIAGCSAVKLPSPTQTNLDKISEEYPDATLAQLSEGKSLYQKKCTMCHGLKKPDGWTGEQWKKIVPGMAKKANKSEEKITAKDQDLILKYLSSVSSSN